MFFCLGSCPWFIFVQGQGAEPDQGFGIKPDRTWLTHLILTTVISIIKTNALINILEDKKGWRYSSS